MTEDEMVGGHCQLNGHEFEQTPGASEGQGGLVCCSPWGLMESGMIAQLNNNKFIYQISTNYLLQAKGPARC